MEGKKVLLRGGKSSWSGALVDGALLVWSVLLPVYLFVVSGLLWTSGAGHGVSFFYEVFYFPKGVGFFLPSLAGLAASLIRERFLCLLPMMLAVIAMGCEGYVIFKNWAEVFEVN